MAGQHLFEDARIAEQAVDHLADVLRLLVLWLILPVKLRNRAVLPQHVGGTGRPGQELEKVGPGLLAPLFGAHFQDLLMAVGPPVVDVAAAAGPVGDQRRAGGQMAERVVGPPLGLLRDLPDVLHRVQVGRVVVLRLPPVRDIELDKRLDVVVVGLAQPGREVLALPGQLAGEPRGLPASVAPGRVERAAQPLHLIAGGAHGDLAQPGGIGNLPGGVPVQQVQGDVQHPFGPVQLVRVRGDARQG